MSNAIELRVVLTQLSVQGTDMWHAQCVDYDIAAQGKSLDEALDRLTYVLMHEASESLKETEKLFGDIPPPPSNVTEQWNSSAGMTLRIEADSTQSPGHVSLAQFAHLVGQESSQVSIEAKCA